jgi:small subunit ribosomal protein S3
VGQKVNPVGLRLGVSRTWDSQWFAKKNFSNLLLEDVKLRKFIKQKLGHAGISRVEIERASTRATLTIYAAKPGIIIGKKGSEIEGLRRELQALTDKQIYVNILEIKRPELDATLVAENITRQLERRIAFRRAMKRAVTTAMDFGAKGIRVASSGRLAGSEIARREWYREGRVPLHTLKADIQFGTATARTTYGAIGVKVWIYLDQPREEAEKQRGGRRNAPAKES